MSDLVKLDGYPFRMYWVNGKKKANYRPVKLYLIEKYGVCYHCEKPVKDYGEILKGSPPHDMATIDHLLPRQFRKRHQRVEKVLSCYRCNHDLNVKVQKDLATARGNI